MNAEEIKEKHVYTDEYSTLIVVKISGNVVFIQRCGGDESESMSIRAFAGLMKREIKGYDISGIHIQETIRRRKRRSRLSGIRKKMPEVDEKLFRAHNSPDLIKKYA